MVTDPNGYDRPNGNPGYETAIVVLWLAFPAMVAGFTALRVFKHHTRDIEAHEVLLQGDPSRYDPPFAPHPPLPLLQAGVIDRAWFLSLAENTHTHTGKGKDERQDHQSANNVLLLFGVGAAFAQITRNYSSVQQGLMSHTHNVHFQTQVAPP